MSGRRAIPGRHGACTAGCPGSATHTDTDPCATMTVPRAAPATACDTRRHAPTRIRGKLRPRIRIEAGLVCRRAASRRTRPPAARARRPDVRAVIHADGNVPHSRVIHTIDALKRAGLVRIAFGASQVPTPADAPTEEPAP